MNKKRNEPAAADVLERARQSVAKAQAVARHWQEQYENERDAHARTREELEATRRALDLQASLPPAPGGRL